MTIMRETDTFDGFVNFGTHIAARMRREMPSYEPGLNGRWRLSETFMLDRATLEKRIRNREAAGLDASESRRALDAWPATKP